jgi:hypothetical protein
MLVFRLNATDSEEIDFQEEYLTRYLENIGFKLLEPLEVRKRGRWPLGDYYMYHVEKKPTGENYTIQVSVQPYSNTMLTLESMKWEFFGILAGRGWKYEGTDRTNLGDNHTFSKNY